MVYMIPIMSATKPRSWTQRECWRPKREWASPVFPDVEGMAETRFFGNVISSRSWMRIMKPLIGRCSASKCPAITYWWMTSCHSF